MNVGSTPRAALGGLLGVVLLAAAPAACDKATAQIDTVDQAVACIHEALGGRDRIAAVSAIRLDMQSTPVQPAGGAVALPTTTEITVAWPDKFRRETRAVAPRGAILHGIRGIAGDEAFSASVNGDEARRLVMDADGVKGVRRELAQWAYMLLARDTSTVPLQMSLDRSSMASGANPILVAGAGDDIDLHLEFDATTCLPASMWWRRAPNMGDSMAGRVPTNGRFVEKRELLDYRVFEGVQVPTRMRWSTDDVVRSQWTVTSVEINPVMPADFVPAADTEPVGSIFW